MELQENQYVYIQSYKHDGSLHQDTGQMGYVLEANEKRIVAVTNRTLVSESDGRKWVTREPAICFFYPDKWYNVICMIRKTGIHYYCNLASPSIYDGEAIKNIDYDLDVKVSPTGKTMLLDEDEYEQHAREMGIQPKRWIKRYHRQGLDRLMVDIRLRNSPFEHHEINALYERYLACMELEKKQ
ncbi:MAG: DUF402 domain-containing protein [Longicatena caecimuris]|uniref:DUF402 domain-containing protein n=1 Tax=Longicatena caecimuris TaxID=1796635 RepID=UPI003995C967